MNELTRRFTDHHKHCDLQFANLEQAAAAGAWDRADACYLAFNDDLLRHLAAEEEILFPAFEAATGNAQGPTRVMCIEHEQMRDLLEELSDAMAARDSGKLAGIAETLLVLMQQHNIKEEQILYPMLDELAPPDARDAALTKLLQAA
jgi:iron-sulfur cluster repair protein YtfE (RIC family)